jgi:GMP synthase-like glutamine amidotransferase
MNIHALIHAPYEQPGYIEEWTGKKKHVLTFTNFYEPYKMPNMEEFDWLIVMGGPMGVYEEDKYPWLKEEKVFIKQAVESNKIILGICLGSQLVAEVLGAKVFRNHKKEIGWFEIRASGQAKTHELFNHFPDEFIVFHWHGDTYNLPVNAVHLAESEACKNQAFLYNDRVIGLQFHLEITEKLLDKMLTGGNEELQKDLYIQTEEEIREGNNFCRGNNQILEQLLDKLEKKYTAF